MTPDAADEQRRLIQAADEHLVAAYGVVVDDVVLRTWGNEQLELTYLMLDAAISASGGVPEERDLWAVARAVAFATAIVETRPVA